MMAPSNNDNEFQNVDLFFEMVWNNKQQDYCPTYKNNKNCNIKNLKRKSNSPFIMVPILIFPLCEAYTHVSNLPRSNCCFYHVAAHCLLTQISSSSWAWQRLALMHCSLQRWIPECEWKCRKVINWIQFCFFDSPMKSNKALFTYYNQTILFMRYLFFIGKWPCQGTTQLILLCFLFLSYFFIQVYWDFPHHIRDPQQDEYWRFSKVTAHCVVHHAIKMAPSCIKI